MKTSNKDSGNQLHRPEIEKPRTRTLEEVVVEIQEIINNTHWVESRLAKLKDKGYQLENSWVKNGSNRPIWYMKRKQVYRIQAKASESRRDYYKAYCIDIPSNQISMQVKETTKVINMPINIIYNEITTTSKS